MGCAREDNKLVYEDGEGYLTLTVARDPCQPQGPQVTGADWEGQPALLPL
jgi:hypothetical protein